MRVYLLVVDGGLKALADDLDILPDLLEEEVGGELFAGLALLLVPVELDDAGVVEVANLLEACLEDVALHVPVDLAEGLELLHDLGADGPDGELIVGLVEQVAVDIAEGEHEQLLDQHDLHVVDLSFQLLQALLLYLGTHALVLLG